MKFGFYPKGVCSRYMEFDVENDIIKDAVITGGCGGNLQGIAKLIRGMTIEETISRLRGIDCGGRGTSCPDQIANALEQFKLSKAE